MLIIKNVVRQLATLTFCGLVSSAVYATPIELVTNGGFESGDFTGWIVTDSGSGTFEVTSALAPSNGTFTTVGASQGSFYAVSSQSGPGTHALSQSFLVPLNATQVIMTFDMFVQTFAGLTINPAGLDETAFPNQHARVDLLSAGARAFDTGAGVLANFYIGLDGIPTQPYISYLFDITALVTPGLSYDIRFAQSDNQGNFNQGVDNVSIQAQVQVPAPATLVLLGLGIVGLGWSRRKKA
ncbi:PEP-CTERM sorting domain-containing protein [Arsukibacterium sp.]|uniref:PEP-CTERM sorting domain-containing protein n=1 Tax=Arsukibacterium sp. TaxID=1977258 RepID=UPI0035664B60